MRIEFRHPADYTDVRRLAEFVGEQDLGYPEYHLWVRDVLVPDIDSGWKKAFFALEDGDIVGNLISQEHKELPGLQEIKNLRVHPNVRGGHYAMFMMKQYLRRNPGPVIADVRTNQRAVVSCLNACGFRSVRTANIYGNGEDLIMLRGNMKLTV